MIAVLAAPTNLGLRPPEPGSVPGCAKAPEALRDAGVLRNWPSETVVSDAGAVLPGRYRDDPDLDDGRLRNQDELVTFSRRLGARVASMLDDAQTPLLLGGDCSMLVGVGLALASRSERFGLVHVDGHTDFRNPANSEVCRSAAGEDLAIVTGNHWPEVADIDGWSPYFEPDDVVHLGCRDDDEYLEETRSTIRLVLPASELLTDHETALERVLGVLTEITPDRYWLHIDLDVLDPQFFPAVDSPDPGGLSPAQLIRLLERLAPRAVGASVGIYDPDLDPEREYAAVAVKIITEGLARLAADGA